jgi:8-oxo-dGTP diphosphatase
MARPRSRTPEEQRYLQGYDAGRFPHPSVTVDVALLIRRQQHPDRGQFGLPGGFVRLDESLDQAAVRLLADKAGLASIFLEQLYTFGAPDRDPRTRVITVAYYALVPAGRLRGCAPPDAAASVLAALVVPWKGERGGPVTAVGQDGQPLPLAFDHDEILGLAVKRLRGKLNYAPIGFELLPPRFTLRQLQDIHETILARRLNKDSFRRRMLASDLLAATGRRETDVGHRPAELYRFKRRPSL